MRQYILIGLCTLCTYLIAGEGFAQRHARTIALGEVGVGLIGSGQAILYNPAGLAFMERREAYFTYIDWPSDTEEHNVGISANVLGKGAFGLYAERNSNSEDYAIFGGYGQKIADRIAVGTTFKLIHNNYQIYSPELRQFISQIQNKVAFDLGAYVIGARNMAMSVGLKNVSSDSLLQKDARLGLLIDMFALINAGVVPHHLDVVLDMEIPINFDRDKILSAAIEYGYTHYGANGSVGFSLRLGGFWKDIGDRNYISTGSAKWGCGLHSMIKKGLGVKIDYTPYSSQYGRETGHIFSLSLLF